MLIGQGDKPASFFVPGLLVIELETDRLDDKSVTLLELMKFYFFHFNKKSNKTFIRVNTTRNVQNSLVCFKILMVVIIIL